MNIYLEDKRTWQEQSVSRPEYAPLRQEDVELALRVLKELKERVFHIHDLLNEQGPYEEPRELHFGEDPPTGEWKVVREGVKAFIPTEYLSMTDAQILQAASGRAHQKRLREIDRRIYMTRDAIANAEKAAALKDQLTKSLAQLQEERERELKKGAPTP